MISDAIGLRKLILKTKGSNGSKSADETYFPAFQGRKSITYARSFEEECSVCHLRLKR